MNTISRAAYEPWPELPYDAFKSTAHLLHMGTQAIGKLKLLTPYEPEWANVALWLTSSGLTTGPIPYGLGSFTVDIDLIGHHIVCVTSWGRAGGFELKPMSVAQFTKALLDTLRNVGVDTAINPIPQEIPNPIPFHEDIDLRAYDSKLANAWWRIMLGSYQVMERYHARFNGKTPPIGFMWGTFDLRDARYNGPKIPTTGPNSGFLRRNAMDEAQIEAGWWSGTDAYQKPAYYSFTYPQPEGIEKATIVPRSAHWEKAMGEFLFDYDDLRQSKDPEQELTLFLESTYHAGAERAGWDPDLVSSGRPI